MILLLTGLFVILIVYCVRYLLDLSVLDKKLKDYKIPPERFILGHLLDINPYSDVLGILGEYFKRYGKLIRINMTKLIPTIIITDAEVAKQILISRSMIWKGTIYDCARTLFGDGLPLRNDDWHSVRKLLTPPFTIRNLEKYLRVFNKVASTLINRLDRMKNEEISIESFIELSVLENSYECLTGEKINSSGEEDKINNLIKEVLSLLPEKVYKPWTFISFIYVFTPTFWKERRLLKETLQETSNIISKRQFKEKTRDPQKYSMFIDVLINGIYNGKKYTKKDIRDELNTFIMGSRDTTSVVLTCSLYILGHHPKIQDRIYAELSSIFKDDPFRAITVDDIQKMEYLQAVLHETMRLYPPVPLIARRLNEDQIINGILIPSNMNVIISIYNMHRQEEYFPNPDVFDPERFMSGKEDVKPFTFIPFSAGYRNCLGQKFAMYSMKITMANILRRFKIESVGENKITFMAHVLAKIKEDLKIKIHPRN